MSHDRVCIRGCMVKGQHAYDCAEVSGTARLVHAIFGSLPAPCTGCVPRQAADGSYLCTRCISQLRHAVEEAPDVCAHLRSLMDPAKSGWNFTEDPRKPSTAAPTSRVSSSRPPLSADMVDAADEVLGILTYFAEVFGDQMDYSGRHKFEAGTESEDAYYLARTPAWFLLENFAGIVNDHRVEGFATAVLGPAPDEETWTITAVMRRWPLVERAHFARVPCPNPACQMRTIRVMPPKRAGQRTEYECRACHWVPPVGEYELWQIYLEEGIPA